MRVARTHILTFTVPDIVRCGFFINHFKTNKSMKANTFKTMALCAALAALAAACGKKSDLDNAKPDDNSGSTSVTVSVAKVTLSQAAATLTVGDTLRLTATVAPDSATNKAVTWTSSDTAVAAVANGLITAVTAGTATIIAATADGGKTATCALTVVPAVTSWNSAFGTTSFATTQTWKVGAQTWSDAVEATGCNKTTFNGNNPDCRSNPGYKGDLFSWYAVDSYKNQLCPDGWRVPTRQDFIDLDIALGGKGYTQYTPSHRDKYLNNWGGVYGGLCDSYGTLGYQGSDASYWVQSEEYSSSSAYILLFDSIGYISPDGSSITKNYGLSLRCVK